MAAGSYAYLGEAVVGGAGAAFLGEAAGPPPAAALPGEAAGPPPAAALPGEAGGTSALGDIKLPEQLEVVNVLLVLLLDERQKTLPGGGVDLGVVVLNPKVWCLGREGGSVNTSCTHFTH